VHEQFKLPERLREDALIAGLASQSSSARGNLAVTQAGNAITLQVIEELRKVRQLLGASMNAQNVALTHHINLQASQDRIVHDWIERSQIPVSPYRGSGGFGPNDYNH
jgi:P-type conjugative transfer protein TrbJ